LQSFGDGVFFFSKKNSSCSQQSDRASDSSPA